MTTVFYAIRYKINGQFYPQWANMLLPETSEIPKLFKTKAQAAEVMERWAQINDFELTDFEIVPMRLEVIPQNMTFNFE